MSDSKEPTDRLVNGREEQLEEQLEEQIALNKRTERALEVSRAGTFSWEPTTFTFEWNTAFSQLHGFSPDVGVVSYADFFARIPEDDRDSLEAGVLASRDARTAYDVIYRVIWPNDRSHWIHARGIWEYADDGTPVRLFGIGSDVDRRMAFEQKLIAGEQRLADAEEVSQQGSWEIDLTTNVMTVSEGFRRLQGVDAVSFPALDVLLYVPKSDHHILLDGYAQAAQPGGKFDVEHCMVHGTSG